MNFSFSNLKMTEDALESEQNDNIKRLFYSTCVCLHVCVCVCLSICVLVSVVLVWFVLLFVYSF